MEIYEATEKDIEGISKLFNQYRIFYKQESDIDGATTYIKDRIENGESVIFIVKDEDNYLGFTQLYPSFSSISMSRTIILNDLFVDESARKQGVGELLLNRAKEYAVENKLMTVSLSTGAENKTAQKLYEKLGYERDEGFYHYELNVSK